MESSKNHSPSLRHGRLDIDPRVDQLTDLRTQISKLSSQRNKIIKSLKDDATSDPSKTKFEGQNTELKICRSSSRVLNLKNLKKALYCELKGEPDHKIEQFYKNLVANLPKQDKIDFK